MTDAQRVLSIIGAVWLLVCGLIVLVLSRWFGVQRAMDEREKAKARWQAEQRARWQLNNR